MSYTRISNTVVSGSELLSNLSGDDVRALNFQDSINNEPPINAEVAPVLTVDQLVQATTSRLLVIPPGSASRLGLGEDTQENAASLVKLFNFTSTNQHRVLTFTNGGGEVADGANVSLGLNSGVSTHVWVNFLAGKVGSPAAVQSLFLGSQTTSAKDVNVLVYPSNVSAGSEVVNFSIAGDQT